MYFIRTCAGILQEISSAHVLNMVCMSGNATEGTVVHEVV